MEMAITALRRGYHLITQELLSRLPQLPENGLLNFFIKQHTSAALTINENADPDVRLDFASLLRLNRARWSYFKHIYEGDDDMSAHIKASLLGASLTIPIRGRVLDLGYGRVSISGNSVTVEVHVASPRMIVGIKNGKYEFGLSSFY